MSGPLLVFGIAAAVVIFWSVGAHNRITGLRNALHAAWPPLDELLIQRGQMLGALADMMQSLPHGDSSPAQALHAALGQVRSACGQVRARPSDRDAMAGLRAAEAALAPVLARVQEWMDQDADASLTEGPRQQQAALQLLEPRLTLARQALNDAAARYNDAVTQFPTNMLAPLLRVRPAGQF